MLQVYRWLKKPKILQKEDKEKWDAIDIKNQADSVLYQTIEANKRVGRQCS